MFSNLFRALGVASVLSCASVAHAVTFDPVANPWVEHEISGSPSGEWYFYPALGQTNTWLEFSMSPGTGGRLDLWIETDDPAATVTWGGPNQWGAYGTLVDYGLVYHNVHGAPAYATWNQQILPRHTVINFELSASFDDCGTLDLGNFYGFCSSSPYFWGNASAIQVTSTAPARVFFGPSNYELPPAGGGGAGQPGPVPEPTTWAMMLIGFFGAGGVLRASRTRTVSA